MSLKLSTFYNRILSITNIHVLLALCAAHCLNDLLQSVVTAVYPMLKTELNLDFAQIGLITLVYQIAASTYSTDVRSPSASLWACAAQEPESRCSPTAAHSRGYLYPCL